MVANGTRNEKQDLEASPTSLCAQAVITRNLLTLDGVSKEMAKVYKAARRGTLPTQDASRLTYILDRPEATMDKML